MAHEPERCPWDGGRWIAEWPAHVRESLSTVEDVMKNQEAWVKHPGFPGWNFLVTFSPTGTPVGFRIEAEKGLRWNHWLSPDPALRDAGHSPEAPPITARFLRRLPLGEIQQAAQRAVLRSAALDDRASGDDTATKVSDHWKRIFEESRRPGRRGRDDRFYAELAAAYVGRTKSSSNRPLEELADEMGYSASQIRNLLYAARQRGILTAAPAGRCGGELTPKAQEIIRDEQSGRSA